MRKKLEGNGLWESSRMMLPEHVKRINEHSGTLALRERPNLDNQELEQIGRRLLESFKTRSLITVRMFHPTEQLQVVGMVDRIDQRGGSFMVNGDWFLLEDIEGVDDAY